MPRSFHGRDTDALPPHTATANQTPAAHRLVARGALADVLSSAPPGGVLLVCAPAGSGKTELLRAWAGSEDQAARVAWVSVERGEQDAQKFWLSVVGALRAAAGEVVERVSPSPAFRGDAVVDRLLADLRALEHPVVLILDDLHELASAEALRLLERLLGRVPALLRVALATRQDPGLGLHRLRLSGRLTEIRGADLRFSLDETRRLLEATGVVLDDDALRLLHERTEGWAAGLRLAALSLAKHPDPVRFVSEFSGSERTVAGYLVAEVLEHQPAEVRDLLLRTSLVERVSGPLADFLTGASGSERTLQRLEDENAFVVSLDAGRSLFRYHHLFADLLRLELRRTAPGMIAPLHRAAAQWYEQQHATIDAIRHAQAAGDWPDAARLIVDGYISLVFDGRTATLRSLLATFPPDTPDRDPELALAFARCRLNDGLLEESASYVAVAERLGGSVPADRRGRFELQLAAGALSLARRRGNLEAALETMRSVEDALAVQPAGGIALGNELRAAALMNVGIAELWSSRLRDARRHLEQALELARRIGRPYLEVTCLAHLAIAAPLAGLPVSLALERSEQALAIAQEHGWAEDPVSAPALAVNAVVLLWLGRFAEADRRLQHARRTLRPEGEPNTELIIHQATGLLAMARRDFDAAFAAYDAADRMQALLADEHVLSEERRSRVAEMQAWRGDTAAARATLARMGAADHDRAGSRIAEAAVHLADSAPEAALAAVAPVLERRERALMADWEALDASLLAAQAHDQLGDRAAAEAAIEHALELAEPEGIVLPFVVFDVGDLLERHRGHRTAHAALLSEILDLRAGGAARPRGTVAPLDEELSAAELRVVRYLPSNLKTPEIASELFVSANTVRTHMRHIYAKLDAHSRSEAVARARELGLLAPASRRR